MNFIEMLPAILFMTFVVYLYVAGLRARRR